MSKKKYSHYEKRAYWMGYGAGICNGDATYAMDTRMGAGQREDLCNSMRKGFFAGKKNSYSNPFEKGFKRYPVPLKVYIASEVKPKTKKPHRSK